MNVFTQANEKFYKGLETLIVSFCVNNNFEKNTFFIVNTDFSKKHLSCLKKLSKNYDFKLFLISPSKKEFQDEVFKNSPRYIYEGMIRLLMHKYVPKYISRIIYLDADIIINKSIKEFYYQDFDEKYIIVHSTRKDGLGNFTFDIESGLFDMMKIPLPKDNLIFNNGVFIADLDKWRIDINEDLYYKFAKKYSKDIMFIDQDLMNLVFGDKAKKIIDRNYNCTYRNSIKIPKNYYDYISKNTCIIHYVEKIKPWMFYHYTSKLFHFFMKYFKINHPLLSIYMYFIFYCFKPFHFFKRAIKKIFREIKFKVF